ncbi:LacI family transcriptional regulator [Clostridia bacterium]|nr:LacI family transcriptional regulator [Clostridia bacterium]
MKKTLSLLTIFAMLIVMAAGCANSSAKLIGVCMPKHNVDRWLQDGDNIRKQLQAKGYEVMLEYADDDTATQIAQIESMIDKKCQALIIAATDSYALNDVLEKARKAKIKIIAYDRLLMHTEFVDYYCTFDNLELGEEQGKYIEAAFGLQDAASKPINMEIISGASDDSCAVENYNGQMNVLKPYIDSGKIIAASGETGFEATAIADWSTENAEAYMRNLLSAHYANGEKLDAVLATNDSIARGVITVLKEAGYESGSEAWPVITGQDCDAENVAAIIDGEQSMSMFVDTRALSTRAADLVDDVLSGKTPTINNTTRYDNEVKIVPASICKSIYVDKDNYLEILVRSGYFKEEDFQTAG